MLSVYSPAEQFRLLNAVAIVTANTVIGYKSAVGIIFPTAVSSSCVSV